MEWYLSLTVIFNDYLKLGGKVSKKRMSNLDQFTSTVWSFALAFLNFHC